MHRITSQYFIAKDGQWVGRPQAALSGLYNGQQANVLLQLDMPMYDQMSNTMTFQYGVLAANNTDLPAVDGTVNAYAVQALSADRSMQNRTLSVVSPGDTVFYSASLVIDVVGIEDYTTNVKAQTEAGLINVDLGEGNYYYGYGYGR